MRNILIFLFIITVMIYAFTGRTKVMVANVKGSGISALLDEPVWLGEWVGGKWQGFVDRVNAAIDGASAKTKH